MRNEFSRRTFVTGIVAATGGLALGFSMRPAGQAASAHEINAWVEVNPDETVVIRIARSEMGQGVLTGLAQLVAEELDCDWSKVKTTYPTPLQSLQRHGAWHSFATGGSMSIRGSQDYLRAAGAAARELLKEAAARRWQVDGSEISAANGVLTHMRSGRTTTFGQVSAAAARLDPAEVLRRPAPLKQPKDWKLIGKSVARLDTAPKIDGSQVYGIDFKLPGLLNAAIRACPVFGGRVASFDGSKAKAMPGVRHVVAVGDTAVAVVADTWWQAQSALAGVEIKWNEGPGAGGSTETFAVVLKEGLGSAKDVFVGNRHGEAVAAIAGAARKVVADFSYPHQHHATLEPMNATALWTPRRCDVWCPTQNSQAALTATALAAGLAEKNCDVHKLMIGGGFGRRDITDFVTQAVLIAKQVPGAPVKLIWSREEDMAHGFYHPVTMGRMTGGLDASGNLVGLHMRISGQSILASMRNNAARDSIDRATLFGRGQAFLHALHLAASPEEIDPTTFQGLQPVPAEDPSASDHSICYAVPHLLIDHAMRNPHVPPGYWRGENTNQNAIFLECFMDEMAAVASVDALAFRLRLLAHQPRAASVLRAVAQKGGWGQPPRAGVDGRGLAFMRSFATFVAAMAEVSISGAGRVNVRRLVIAIDPGTVVNPRLVEMQVEGSLAFGLGAMLKQACTVKNGRIVEQNFDTYPPLLLDEMPVVETIVMPSGGWWGGVGEPAVAVAAPAVLNAMANATGSRIRDLPVNRQLSKRSAD